MAEDDVFKVLRDWVLKLQEQKLIAYPLNIPAGRLPIRLQMDRGGESTKLMAKLLPCERADAVSHCLLLGFLDRVKDTRAAIEVAFGPVFRAVNAINAQRMYVPICFVPVIPDEVSRARFSREGAEGKYELSGLRLEVAWTRTSPRKRKR